MLCDVPGKLRGVGPLMTAGRQAQHGGVNIQEPGGHYNDLPIRMLHDGHALTVYLTLGRLPISRLESNTQ
jgi:hypothetical protein